MPMKPEFGGDWHAGLVVGDPTHGKKILLRPDREADQDCALVQLLLGMMQKLVEKEAEDAKTHGEAAKEGAEKNSAVQKETVVEKGEKGVE